MKYKNETLNEISFPLGGIGSGSIGLKGDGRLADWEIFNKPSKGSINGYSHIAVRALKNGKIIPAVLNGDLTSGFSGQYKMSREHTGFGFGADEKTMCGFPHFENVIFNGEFPVAELSFEDKNFPANVKMTAFNPFIPLDSFNSSLPAAFFEIELENNTSEDVRYQVAFSLANPFAVSFNKSENSDGIHMISMFNAGADKSSTEYGSLTIATDCENAFVQTYWYRGKWQDGIVSFWNDFSSEIEIKDRTYDENGKNDVGTLFAQVDVCSGEKKSVKFVLSWNVPNYVNYWVNSDEERFHRPWKNYYATVFESSEKSAEYSLKNWNVLRDRTEKFRTALHGSSLPECVKDATSANLSVLKSPTVLRLEDGSFYGWEGVGEHIGSCEGTCQHVWNYAYALCFLFPDLERSIRDLTFNYALDKNGRTAFRVRIPLGTGMADFRACVDGQMGEVIKCYREWKISGDDNWLRSNWENIKNMLEYAWSKENPDCWDLNKDGVLEGRQHHTLDMELFGPSSWLEGMYLAALKSASEMAEYLDDTEKANEYGELFESGKEWTKKNLFNGEWFVQKVDITDRKILEKYGAENDYWNDEKGQIKYQIDGGSSIDQLLGQWHGDILGLGDIFDREQVDKALDNMVKNNFKERMRDFVNPWRIFSLNDEAGSVICDYPDGTEKPAIPISYCEETMTGFEYSFAGLLCSRGKTDSGLKAVEAVRNRFEGGKRNPWNEFECGSNYARSMASYALLPILSGFEFDMPRKHMGFNPYSTKDFRCVWSLAPAWGEILTDGKKTEICIAEGTIKLKSIGLKFLKNVSDIKIDGKSVPFEFKDGRADFDETSVNTKVEIFGETC